MQNIITEMWPIQMAVILQTTFSNAFSPIKIFALLSIFRRTLFPWVQCVRERKSLKICCRQIPDSLEQKLWNVQVICIHFSQCCIFRCSFGCHSKGLPLNHKDVCMRCNEGPHCMIFKFNVLSTHIFAKQLRLQGSVNYSPKSSCIISPKSERQNRSSCCVCDEWNLVD